MDTGLQLILFLVAAGAIGGTWWLGRRLRRNGAERAFEISLGLFAAALVVGYNIYYLGFTPPDISRKLPLQLCNILDIIVPVALLTRWRPARALVYFWGIGLSTQAVLTPMGEHVLTDPRFYIFWATHILILVTATYELAVAGYRPTLADLRTAIAAGALYLALTLPLNLAFGWNYGFTGNALPDNPSLLDFLGPWPWRIGIMFALACAMFLLLWVLGRARRRDSGNFPVVDSSTASRSSSPSSNT